MQKHSQPQFGCLLLVTPLCLCWCVLQGNREQTNTTIVVSPKKWSSRNPRRQVSALHHCHQLGPMPRDHLQAVRVKGHLPQQAHGVGYLPTSGPGPGGGGGKGGELGVDSWKQRERDMSFNLSVLLANERGVSFNLLFPHNLGALLPTNRSPSSSVSFPQALLHVLLSRCPST